VGKNLEGVPFEGTVPEFAWRY